MLSRTKRFAGVAAAALAVSAGIPATTAGAAAGPCTAVVSQSTGSEVAILLEGHYRWPKSSTADVRLTCHIVQNDVTVVSVTDPLTGHVAALASDVRIGTDPWYVCYSIYVTNRPNLPPYPTDFYSYSNC